jgi:hypothetical protein
MMNGCRGALGWLVGWWQGEEAVRSKAVSSARVDEQK